MEQFAFVEEHKQRLPTKDFDRGSADAGCLRNFEFTIIKYMSDALTFPKPPKKASAASTAVDITKKPTSSIVF
jgi:hypothetical protein